MWVSETTNMSADSWGNLAGDKHFAAHRKERFECMVGAYTHGTHISAVYLCLLLYETSVRVYLYGCPSACLTLSESVYTDVMRWMVVCVWVCVYAECVMRHPFCQNKGPLASLHSYSDRWDFQPASIFARRLECPFRGSSDGLFDPF